MNLTIKPLTRERFSDFEQLFGPRGAVGGCWCMYWKLRGKAFEENTGAPARQMQKLAVEAGEVPGLIAYENDLPIGWIAVEPRHVYNRLAHSRVLKPVDDQPVWSVPCFFVDRNSRHRGVTVALLRAAIEHVRERGGSIVEGYPIETSKEYPAAFIYTGIASAFKKAGFKEVARNSETRPIYRYYIGG
jgi:GNAT superfamily N-acetyltransferase